MRQYRRKAWIGQASKERGFISTQTWLSFPLGNGALSNLIWESDSKSFSTFSGFPFSHSFES